MRASSHSDLHLGRAGDWAFILTVAAGYVSTLFIRPFPYSPAEFITLLALGALYVTIGTVGIRLFDRLHSRPAWLLYFAIEIALAMVMLFLGAFGGSLWLITLPLVSQSVLALPRPWTMVVSAAAVVFGFTVPLGLLAGWASALPSTIFFLTGVFFVVIFTQIALHERQARGEVERLAAELAQANEKLRQHAVQAEELATAKERNRLAREIHDSLGHYLTVINVQLEAARAIHDEDPEKSLEAIHKAQSLAREGLADVRRSIAALRASPIDERPLPEALEALVEECRAAGLFAALAVSGSPRRISAQAERALYRAAQEGLTNVRKHARASRCDVQLDYGGSSVRLIIQDNGVGAGENTEPPGFGLLGVQERAELLGGRVSIASMPGLGFRLMVELPA
ncbi:MAG TPA: sensor histidine kinase [Anaerolineales bacterium]|nr:sensor histidine kinase [Anaerolineales bacterium]